MPMKKPLPRRTFLKGSGVALAIPFLEAMLPANKTWAAEPERFILFYTGLGVASNEGKWTGTDGTPTPEGGWTWHSDLISTFAPYASKATFIRGLQTQGILNNHWEMPAFMANCPGKAYSNYKTVDLYMVELLNAGAPITSGLNIGGWAASRKGNFNAWLSQNNGARTKMYEDPKELFNLISNFGGMGGTGSGDASPANPLKKDVLSLAMDSINSLKKELGAKDKAILDQTLTSYRQAELAIEKAESGGSDSGASCGPSPTLLSSYDGLREQYTLPVMAELCSLIINCDLTRTITVTMLPDESGSYTTHDHLLELTGYGVGDAEWSGYHGWTHAEWSSSSKGNFAKPKCMKAMEVADYWEANSVVRKFLDNLNTGVIDSSAIIYGSGGQYDGRHPNAELVHKNIPFLMFGGLNGKVTPKGLNNPILRDGYDVGAVWLTLLKKLGYSGNSFGSYNATNTISL